MAARRTPVRRGREQPKTPQYQCRDCAESYDWRDKALDGHLICCKCRFYKDAKWYKFLHDPQCEHFVKRDDKPEGYAPTKHQ